MRRDMVSIVPADRHLRVREPSARVFATLVAGKGAKHLVVALLLDGEELMPEALRGHDVAIAGIPAEAKTGMSMDFNHKLLQGQGSRV
jgi:hypothetical protein